jgi:hypothetical protein
VDQDLRLTNPLLAFPIPNLVGQLLCQSLKLVVQTIPVFFLDFIVVRTSFFPDRLACGAAEQDADGKVLECDSPEPNDCVERGRGVDSV